jgi:hypothetical protein
MASFIGTRKEFKRYIGPRLRNLVNLLTKNHRIRAASCNHCGAKERLESAHVRGRERNQIIDVLLEGFTHNEIITIDLEIFERKFVAEHDPIDKTILILCRDCHLKYDATTNSPQVYNEVSSELGAMAAPKRVPTYSSSSGQLPIKLIPSDAIVFKMELLRTRKAQITTKYDNGQEEVRVWNAPNFSPTSNVLGNLRSRPEFRQGQWQARGIAKVTVRVVE